MNTKTNYVKQETEETIIKQNRTSKKKAEYTRYSDVSQV